MAYFFLRRTQARRASRDYLVRVRRLYPETLPTGPLWLVSFRHFLEFGLSLIEKYLAWTEDCPMVSMVPPEEAHLLEVAKSGTGCLLIGSHFGNLEYSRGISRRHVALTINVLLHDRHAVKFATLMANAEPESRMNLIQVTEIDLALTLRLKEKVSQGEWVVIAGDRVPVTDNAHTADVGFMGDEASFPIGPYVLASVLQCPVFLLHCYRVDSLHHLGFERFSDRIELQREDRENQLRALAQQFATALEGQVVIAPLQWFNFYDFWGDRRSS
jgi:predicted LPLAT superfamily acyltransferase